MKNDDRILQGLVGLGLSSALWLLCSWRLIFHTLVRRQVETSPGEESAQRIWPLSLFRRVPSSETSSEASQFEIARWFTRRRTFHCLMWMATTCEALAYADEASVLHFSKNRIFSDKLGYVLLDIAGRSILELLAFCTVTAMWLNTAIESNPVVLWGSDRVQGGVLPQLFLLVILLLVLASATVSVVALILFQDDDLDRIEKLKLAQAQTMLESIAWGVHSMVVLECLTITSRRVLNLIPASERKQRYSLLAKSVLPMLISSFAYASRCIWLVAVFLGTSKIERGTWAWWIGFMWLPTWMAVLVLLYSARKRDQLPTTREHLQPLLPSQPPAAAFLAFSQHRQGLEVDDSFSFCRSPIAQVLVPRDDIEVADKEVFCRDDGLESKSAPSTDST